MKLTSIFQNQDILQTPSTNIQTDQIQSKIFQKLTTRLLNHLDSLNLAAITPQNIFPQTQNPNEHFLNMLIFRDKNQNPQIIYNPQILNEKGEKFNVRKMWFN